MPPPPTKEAQQFLIACTSDEKSETPFDVNGESGSWLVFAEDRCT